MTVTGDIEGKGKNKADGTTLAGNESTKAPYLDVQKLSIANMLETKSKFMNKKRETATEWMSRSLGPL